MKKLVLIIGAGPAGLTAAFELSKDSQFEVVVVEQSSDLGGISKTVNYKGNRIDIGGHRFFSKSKRVMEWWLERLPISEEGMLIRNRKSSILYKSKYFDYPLNLSFKTLKKLGFVKTLKVGFSFLLSIFKSDKKAINLEEFFIARFGNELYQTFFKNYTEKVWGKKCSEINADWGAQRIKDLSLGKAILSVFKPKSTDLYQKDTSTSLIEEFLYPKYGPGMMWETVAKQVKENGGKIFKNTQVVGFEMTDNIISKVKFKQDGDNLSISVDFVISSMPMKFLLRGLKEKISDDSLKIAENLEYRDFIMIGLLFKKDKKEPKDNWIYLHDENIKASRLQIFNNWSPYMVENEQENLWIGLEYFCQESDEIWTLDDQSLFNLAIDDFEKTGITTSSGLLDAIVIRMPKTYPSYTGVYEKFEKLRTEMENFPNLFLIGRNGMHKYNNQDHSMLTAMRVVEKIQSGDTSKADIWEINTEMEYHER